MKNSTPLVKVGKSLDDAINEGLSELGLSRDEAEIEIIEEGSKGFLGLGAKEACVRIYGKVSPEKRAVKFLSSMVSRICDDVEYNVETDSEGRVIITMSGPNMGILIGRHGDTLDALQYLTSLYINKISKEYVKIVLDTENYRAKRKDTLVKLARRLGSQVVKTGQSITLEPMSPGERRIIHSTLQNNKLIQTVSVGEEPNRRVVIEHV
ncbi:MAG: protein jag [Clostridia bacterium]|nr:protein jag [Clostridia bacterium]